MKKQHEHKIMTDKIGKVMDDNGWYLCECGAKTFPNCGWFESKNNKAVSSPPPSKKE